MGWSWAFGWTWVDEVEIDETGDVARRLVLIDKQNMDVIAVVRLAMHVRNSLKFLGIHTCLSMLCTRACRQEPESSGFCRARSVEGYHEGISFRRGTQNCKVD
jgi:hypothetical protein